MKQADFYRYYHPHRRPVRREPPVWVHVVGAALFLGLILATITVAEAACRAMGCGA